MSFVETSGLPDQVRVQTVEGEQRSDTLILAVQGLDAQGFALATSDPAVIEALAVGKALQASYADPSGLCRFDSVVLDQTPGDPTIVTIEPPRKIEHEQRRRYIRAEVDIPVACALLVPQEPSFVGATGQVGNIGAGGLRMAIGNHPALAPGAAITMALDLPGQPLVVVLTKVVDVVGPYFEDGEVIVRVAFTMVMSDDKERLERYVYRMVGGIAPAKTYSSGRITPISP